jgi:hypothetical protein
MNKFTDVVSTKVVHLFMCQTLKSKKKYGLLLTNNLQDVPASYIQEILVKPKNFLKARLHFA